MKAAAGSTMDPVTAAIILCNPKYPHNVGQVVRAASCYAVPEVLVTGNRVELEGRPGYRLPREERMRGRYRVDLRRVAQPFGELPAGTVPVAVELVPGAEDITWFEHPDDAAYVFGPEDGTLDVAVRRLCHRITYLPMLHCANLASTVFMVLFDRHSKRVRAGLEGPLALADGAELRDGRAGRRPG
jgi:tRNA(Leu) C34 or U34 (ribose-2'-O)-methylase TrmL